MAILYIKEHEAMPTNSGMGTTMVWAEPAGTEQTPVTVSGVSAQSAAFSARTKFITITCDGIFSFLVGTNPTATTTNFRIPAGQITTLAVSPALKIAAITNT